MKITLGPSDSIYKIVSTIKKIPNYKSVIIDIHPDNDIFRHSWRGTYLHSVLEEYHIKATFISHNKEISEYRANSHIPSTAHQKSPRYTALSSGKSFWENINNFHKVLFLKKNYLSVFVLLSEFAVLLLVLYIFWTLISPNAKVLVTPAYELENFVYNFRYHPIQDKAAHQFQNYISIPYYTGSIDYKYDMAANVQNITYVTEEARGTLTIKNTFPYTYSLLEKTRVITEDNIIYTFDKRVDVPGGSPNKPGQANVRVTAEERFENGELIGKLGNIPKGKILLIKNLEESTVERKIRGEAASQFKYGETIAKGTVIEDDIKQVETEILNTIKQGKMKHLQANYTESEHILFPDPDLHELHINEFITNSELGASSSFVEGKIDAEIHFKYVIRDEVKKGIESFLRQRGEDEIHLTSYDRNSLTLYGVTSVEASEEKETPGYYLIPTRLPVIKKYNIQKDSLGIISEIKDKIVGLEIEAAKKIILGYEEIDAVKIVITPRWYSIIPDIKARIGFEFDE